MTLDKFGINDFQRFSNRKETCKTKLPFGQKKKEEKKDFYYQYLVLADSIHTSK
jgi:hypothetical protein